MGDLGKIKSISVRPAETSDLDFMVEELKKFAFSFGTRLSLFGKEDYVRNGVCNLILQHVAYIAEKSGRRIGFIVGMVTDHFFNPEIRVLQEFFWWVLPEFRRTKAAILLLDTFLEWGKKNVHWINFGLQTSTPVKDKALLKRGFKNYERDFLLEVA